MLTIQQTKDGLLEIFKQKLSNPYPQYRSYEARFKLGMMNRTFRKHGVNYVVRGQVVLFFERKAPGVTPMSVFSPDEGTMLGCDAHWVTSLEV